LITRFGTIFPKGMYVYSQWNIMTTNPERILCCQANGQVERTIQHKIPSGFQGVLDIRAINIHSLREYPNKWLSKVLMRLTCISVGKSTTFVENLNATASFLPATLLFTLVKTFFNSFQTKYTVT
jgi:hypothetical protein